MCCDAADFGRVIGPDCVMSCLMSLVAGSQVIAMFVAGPVAEKAGIPNLYYGSAAMLVGIGIVGHFKLPRTVKAEAAEAG